MLTSGRYHILTSKSPLTGAVGSGNSAGKWDPFLKFAGYNAVVVRGISEKPVDVWFLFLLLEANKLENLESK